MTEDIGFHFYPPPTEYPFGHRRLEIHVYGQPTLHHYDPERVDFFVVSLDGGREKLTVSHGWQGLKSYQVCLGRITLHDRKGKVVEAFSFGGDLTITQEEDVIICNLISDAPILDLVTPQSINTRLAAEFEALLARLQATWKQHPAMFTQKLISLGPQTLFVAGLESLAHAYEEIPPAVRSGDIREEEHLVLQAISLLKKHDQWPADGMCLEDLLAED